MVEIRESIRVEAAVEKVMKKARSGKVERIPLMEAQGRYLAEALLADHDVPLFDRSTMDGFAICSQDTQQSLPITLKVIEEIGAGTLAEGKVQSGEAVRIMTGAPIPDGADAVIMLEKVEEWDEEGTKFIKINQLVHPGDCIAKQGEDIARGQKLLKKGTRIGVGEIALLATFGCEYVLVYEKPIVGILATGSELVEVDEPLVPGKVRNSNSYMLHAQIEQLGGIAKYVGRIADDFEKTYEVVCEALKEVDFLITTGGVSVGDFDYIPAILERLQAEVLFNKVEMRPGSVTTVAYLDGKWMFGLSGNPASCFVGFELFVRPVLTSYLGSTSPSLLKKQAMLTTNIGNGNAYARFIRARLTMEEATCYVTPVGKEKPGIVSALAETNALLVVPPKTEMLSKGEKVEVLCLQTDFFA